MDRDLEIQEWCRFGELPDSSDFYSTLADDDGKFYAKEGLTFDYKETWPKSLSDAYFAAIVRLILAFANTAGGVIIFGVHDEYRLGGYNRKEPNIDKFLNAVRDLTGCEFSTDFRKFSHEQMGDVFVLLIQPRCATQRPATFLRDVKPYKKNVFWVRNNHEVRQARPADYATLFCRNRAEVRSGYVDGSLPPSPAVVKKFVGRTMVLDQLFQWFENSYAPRTFLFGKGGSGKTTIAHEFARLIKEHGAALKIEQKDPVDSVIFLSAKEKKLVTASAKIADLEDPDFYDELSLLRQILFRGEWTPHFKLLEEYDPERLWSDVKEFLDISSTLIVIDDVDTLTTKGVDPGFDKLYLVLSRAQKRSKVLYTTRNAPSFAIANSIEVPGLEGDDYTNFVENCAAQFGIEPPNKSFLKNDLPEVTEKRPLVIESIVALARQTGSYNQALRLFKQNTGDDIRNYVFEREWITIDQNGRLLLVALVEIKEAASFDTLKIILSADDTKLRDAISEVREMFLEIDSIRSEPLYSITTLTKGFVDKQKQSIKGFATIRERVRNYQRDLKRISPEVASIAAEVTRRLPFRNHAPNPEAVKSALSFVNNESLREKITEDPAFKSIRGYVLARQSPPNLTEARDAFNDALAMKYEPKFGELRAWFEAEKGSKIIDGTCKKIADIVIEGQRYSTIEKIEMISRKATTHFVIGREKIYSDEIEALAEITEALKLHLRAFRLNYDRGDTRSEFSEKKAAEAADYLFVMQANSRNPWFVFDSVRDVLRGNLIYADPLEDGLMRALYLLTRKAESKEARGRLLSASASLESLLGDRENWLDRSVPPRLAKGIREFQSNIRSSLSK